MRDRDEAGTVVVTGTAEAPIDAVWRVLADPWTYPHWVSGTAALRDADQSWPAPGSRLYHRWGPLPFRTRDHTTVLVSQPPSQLVLQARAWPWGVVRAELTMHSSGTTTSVALREQMCSGIGATFARAGHAVQLWRNRRSLASLIRLAEQDRRTTRGRRTRGGR